MPYVPNYYWHKQKGSNTFGGIAILVHNSIKTKVIYAVDNFLLIKLSVMTSSILIGAVYVPPKEKLPLHIFQNFLIKSFIFLVILMLSIPNGYAQITTVLEFY
jgi:hypothetical protein